MINIFSNKQIIDIKFTTGECVVYVNGARLISGTAYQCMSKIRLMIERSNLFYNDGVIKFNIDCEIISPAVANDKSNFINQLKLLSTSCKYHFEIKEGINLIA